MEITVSEPITILALLQKHFPESSNNTLRTWLEKERVTVDGRIVKKGNHLLQKEQILAIGQKTNFIRGDMRIFYEDAHLVVVYKPEGLLSVATDHDLTISAHEILKRRLDGRMVYPVHRLDRETSGIMVFAYSEKARDALKELFHDHAVEREYSAIIEGILTEKQGSWESFLKEDSNYVVKSTPSAEEGKWSVTHYEVVAETKKHSLMRFKLETGRKNQIRVHCKEAGHPVAGDKKYGATTNPIARLALHAAKLGFIHPITNQPMKWEIPLPEAFYKLFPDSQKLR